MNMEHLHSTPITDSYGTIYGEQYPSGFTVNSTINELIDEIEKLKKSKWKSGYLISKFGK